VNLVVIAVMMQWVQLGGRQLPTHVERSPRKMKRVASNPVIAIKLKEKDRDFFSERPRAEVYREDSLG
jgi:hypothetical protein